ncbi:NUMOD4 domain-containing protein [Lentilactobacillus senioris]|uniref:NUMOD4 domain-containing protein n=1 Tax=Lentilactobacillus senioris TaxID=931534 RepID=UPI00227F2D14|nr:NUMOD4 domain-containing protein [Lentilactobacillus senioris]MCY9806539.1 NUMOD4 domain-containing protein [Lentilactobacillus senioris]
MNNWKDIPGYEDIYQVNEIGDVRTAPGKTTYTRWHGVRHWKVRILKQKTDHRNYKRVSLWKNGKEKTYLVHKLVAETFIPKISGKELINHKDGNPANNQVSNLEWCNYSENLHHAYLNHLNEKNNEIVLVDKKTTQTYFCLSFSEADKFLGKYSGYISRTLKAGKVETDRYQFFLPAKTN